MLNRCLILLVIAVLTTFALMLLKGDGPGSGSVLWAITADHGVNSGDLPVLAGWFIAVGAGLALWFRH
jgi:hypothetical protein